MNRAKFINKLTEVETILNELEREVQKNNCDKKDIYQIKLCVDEILTNIINYGFPNEQTQTIEIEYEITAEKFYIKITDNGIEFDPLSKEEPNLELNLDERKIGGLGIFFVKKYMDNCDYKRENNNNILTLSKNFNN